MAKLEDDGLNLAMQDWKIQEVEVDPLLVANEFASIPGFHVVMKKTKETKYNLSQLNHWMRSWQNRL